MSPVSRLAGALVALALAPTARAQADDPFTGITELTPQLLTRLALERSRAPATARAQARAADASAAMAGAVMDPMLSVEVAPVSAFTPPVPFGAAVKLSQRLPFPGQLGLAEKAARLDARAAHLGHAQAAREIRARAATLVAALHAAERTLAVNAAHRALLAELQAAAEARYAAGTAPQADALQAQVMRIELDAEAVELSAQRRVVAAQINALLLRAPAAPVPPTPATLESEASADLPRDESAIDRLPQLEAMSARVEAAGVRITRAERGWLPNLELMASYSSMWMDVEHRFMIGVGVELPVWQTGRRAQLDEANAMAERMRAEQQGMRAMLAGELEEERTMFEGARERLLVLRERLVPAATTRLDAVRAGYVTGKAEFDTVIDAERALRDAELAQHLAEAEVARRRAALFRFVPVKAEGAEVSP